MASASSTASATQDPEVDPTERIMEYQRREYSMLSKIAHRRREMNKQCQESSEVFNAFEDNQKDSLRGAYVDPAVNIEIGMLRQRLREKDQEISRLKDEMQSSQYQPNSIQGKKLLDKCTHLLEENAEIARQLGEERMQVLRIQLTAERQKRLHLRQRIAEFDRHAEQVDAENERMQKKIADLGQTLKETRAEIDKHRKSIEEGRSGKRKRDLVVSADQLSIVPPIAPIEPIAPEVPAVEASQDIPKRHKKEKKSHKDKKKEKADERDN